MKDHDDPTAELDYRAQFQHFPVQLLILDRELRFADANRRYHENTRTRREDLMGRKIFEVLDAPEEIRRPVEEACLAALAGHDASVNDIYYPLPDPDGPPGALMDIWWSATHRPLRNRAGEITHVIQVAEPVTERVKAQKLTQAVMAELEHRIGNLMTLVINIAKRSARSHSRLPAFLETFEKRVLSLAATNRLLTGQQWRGVALEALLREHLAPYLEEGAEISLSGPELRLTANQAQAFSMALHELTTNAAKHGALAREGGRLSVRWSGAPEAHFALTWEESGLAPPPEGEARSGFGTEILTRIFPAHLSGKGEISRSESGFSYRLTS